MTKEQAIAEISNLAEHLGARSPQAAVAEYFNDKVLYILTAEEATGDVRKSHDVELCPQATQQLMERVQDSCWMSYSFAVHQTVEAYPEIQDTDLLTPVESSNLAAVSYCFPSQTLFVRFKSDQVYVYEGVPLNVYEAMNAADSKGSYFSREIKPNYPWRKIEKEVAA